MAIHSLPTPAPDAHTRLVFPSIAPNFPLSAYDPSPPLPPQRAGSNCKAIPATIFGNWSEGADKEALSTAPFSQEACIQLKDFN